MFRRISVSAMLGMCCSFSFVIWAIQPTSANTKLFIVAGQSNASGQASASRLTEEQRAPQPDVLYWYDRDGNTSGGTFTELAAINNRFGPELEAGRVLADRLADDVAIVKVSFGGKPLAPTSGLDWNPNSSGELYDDLIRNVTEAKNALLAEGKQVELAGLFWMQGESDAHSIRNSRLPKQPATANAYEARLNDLILQTRTDLGAEELSFFIGQIKIGNGENFRTTVGTYDNTPIVQAAQASVATNDPRVHLVETGDFDLLFDLIHFSHEGQIDLGAAFANSYLQSVPEPSTGVLACGFFLFFGKRSRRRENATKDSKRIGR